MIWKSNDYMKGFVLFFCLMIFVGYGFSQNNLDLAGLPNSGSSAMCYSLRKLRSNYADPLIRIYDAQNYYDVYPNSANTISSSSTISASTSTFNTAILPAGTNLLSSLLSSGVDIKIAYWYDQSGNNRHVYQSDNSLRPKLAVNGVLCTNSTGGVSANFMNAYMNSNFGTTTCLNDSSYFLNAVVQSTGTTENAFFLGTVQSTGAAFNSQQTLYLGEIRPCQFNFGQNYNHTTANWPLSSTTSLSIRSAFKLMGGGYSAWMNSVSLVYPNPATATTANLNNPNGIFYIGSGRYNTSRWNGLINEIIIFEKDITQNRTDLELNQSNYYSIDISSTCPNNYWVGGNGNVWSNNLNWCNGIIPDDNADAIVVGATNTSVTMDALEINLNNLTIYSGCTLVLTSGTKLTVNGYFKNDGSIIIESGATFVQTMNSKMIGTKNAVYTVKQLVSGAGGSTPNGRSYYLGSPISYTTANVITPQTTGNKLYHWDASLASPSWTQLTYNNTLLSIGKGYLIRMGSNTTLNFSTSGTNNNYCINNAPTGTTIQIPCYRQSTGSYLGFNLVANPFPSYLDWDDVYSANSSNFMSTIWYRIANSSNTMVFDTYNALVGIGTNASGLGAASRYIAPIQAFWVRIPEGVTSPTNLSLTNNMREHYVQGVAGLRSSIEEFPAFLRLNLLQGIDMDQLILYMKPEASSEFDSYDSEKMSLTGLPQFYSKYGDKNLVINGMKNVKAKTSIPLTLEMPSSKTYIFHAEEFNIEDGLILLEDKQEGVIQDLTINPTYSFFGEAGTNGSRFVVHFHLTNAPVLVGGPMELESLVSDELTTDNIQITSNIQGTVIIRLDEGFKPEGSIRIFDASGRLVEQTDLNDQETTIQLNEQAGLYFVEVAAGKLMVKKKIVIE